MKIFFKDTFTQRLGIQIEYIALDSPKRARKFKSELLDRINEIPLYPYRYRKSIYFNDETVRDLVY